MNIKSLGKIEVSRQLSPDFSEVFRIAGTIQYFAGNYFEANQEYQTALEMKPDDPVLLYWYAGFYFEVNRIQTPLSKH